MRPPPPGPGRDQTAYATTSCSEHLSLEELRRADAEASRATDRPR
jgi:hypothetical protein